MMKKIVGLVLALVMMLGIVQIPANAAQETIYDANFNAADNTPGIQFSNSNYRTGTVLSRGYSFNDDLDDTTSEAGISRSMNSVITLEERALDDKAIKFVSVYELNGTTRQENLVSIDPYCAISSESVLHYGFDFMTEDMNVFKSVSLKTTSYGWAWDFLKFNTDGTITFWGKYVASYDVNTWYNIDMYYDITKKTWYLFINDDFSKRAVMSIAMTDLITIRLEGTFDSETDANTVFWVDNLKLNLIEQADLGAMLPYYYNGFDALTPDKTFNTSNGATAAYSSGPQFANETYGSGSGAISAQMNDNSPVTIVERSAGDNAVKIHSKGNIAESLYLHAADVNIPFGADDVIKLAFDYKIDQPNVKAQLFYRTVKSTSTGTNLDQWDFIEFESNGVIYIFNQPVGVYTPGTWYDVEAYYNCADKMWYFYINDEFIYSYKREVAGDIFKLARFTWSAPEGKETDIYLDNYIIDVHATRYGLYTAPVAPTETTLTAVKNTADGAKNVFVRLKSPEAISGKIIAVLYQGKELAEVQVKNATERAYITFIENGDNAKAMWWSDVENNIIPKADAVAIDFAN